jgi:hypothetical protein
VGHLCHGLDLARKSKTGIIGSVGPVQMGRGSIVRPNAHDWKSCEGNTSAGSNPALSASSKETPQNASRLRRLCCHECNGLADRCCPDESSGQEPPQDGQVFGG